MPMTLPCSAHRLLSWGRSPWLQGSGPSLYPTPKPQDVSYVQIIVVYIRNTISAGALLPRRRSWAVRAGAVSLTGAVGFADELRMYGVLRSSRGGLRPDERFCRVEDCAVAHRTYLYSPNLVEECSAKSGRFRRGPTLQASLAAPAS